MQSEGGGFPWFKGGMDDRYITQYILSGIGRLKKLNAIPADLQPALDKMVKSGFNYLDREINLTMKNVINGLQRRISDPYRFSTCICGVYFRKCCSGKYDRLQ